MDRLEYTVLLEAYEQAMALNLEEDFIQLLKEEILDRQTNHVRKKKKMPV
ncbi:sporulation histidine kinase inhibitor Sda [Halalkalibacter alkalisediminis]|uniref:Sporulation histidine kinase inhibitor Sda n=1 Tax=Halalkalibacter alkalisediminis TaxID=935616 RepID=A0ABV6NMR9_9BACI|nr:sporulation histidine kinase inhibitor Sda [Halalkalibacter alkalisediminis]